jgi:hypothetical protein
MDTPMQPSQADLLTRLYDMKQKQLQRALQQPPYEGCQLRCQLLEAEADAISNALRLLA